MGMGFHTPWSSHPSSGTSPAWPWGHRIANMEDAIQRSSRAVQNDDDTKRGSTDPGLLKPWCFLEKGGFERTGWEMVCFVCCKIWSQTNLICVNCVVVPFFDKFMIHHHFEIFRVRSSRVVILGCPCYLLNGLKIPPIQVGCLGPVNRWNKPTS